jgi:hypothetical protein
MSRGERRQSSADKVLQGSRGHSTGTILTGNIPASVGRIDIDEKDSLAKCTKGVIELFGSEECGRRGTIFAVVSIEVGDVEGGEKFKEQAKTAVF